MKNDTIQDERILLERRKIQSTAYAWVMSILLIAIVVQQFFLRAPFAQYAVEFFVLIGCGFYNMISTYKKGIDIWNSPRIGKKKMLLNAVMAGSISVILYAFLSGESGMEQLISYFVVFVIFFFGFRLIMSKLNAKKQQDIDNALNDDDLNE